VSIIAHAAASLSGRVVFAMRQAIRAIFFAKPSPLTHC
jgi:hypothetical protein